MNKKHKKLSDRKCYICGEEEYTLLDVHRIVPGEKGGKYTHHNTVTLCCACHRLVHADKIIIDRWYMSTGGRVLHYFAEDKEYWK